LIEIGVGEHTARALRAVPNDDVPERARCHVTEQCFHGAAQLARGLDGREQAVRRRRGRPALPGLDHGEPAPLCAERAPQPAQIDQDLMSGGRTAVEQRESVWLNHKADVPASPGCRKSDVEARITDGERPDACDFCDKGELGQRAPSNGALDQAPGPLNRQQRVWGRSPIETKCHRESKKIRALRTTLLSWSRGRSVGVLRPQASRVLMPTRFTPGHHPSKLAAADCEPGDELQGGWTQAQLVRMDADFCERMERAIARGLERRPEERPARAA